MEIVKCNFHITKRKLVLHLKASVLYRAYSEKKVLYTYCESQCRHKFDLILTNPNVKTTKQQQQKKTKKHQSLLENRLATEKNKTI